MAGVAKGIWRLSLVLALLPGCATWNISVGRDQGRVNSRQEVAGTTLACAAQAQRSAIWGMAISVLAASASGLLASAASTAAVNGDSSGAAGLSLVSGLSSGLALGANVGAWISLGTSVAYSERAGNILAGLDSTGCNLGPPLPAVRAVEVPTGGEPAATPRAPVQRSPNSDGASATGRCTAAEVNEMRAGGVSDSAIERACAP